MYKDKVKKDLFLKIREHYQVEDEICEIESEYDGTTIDKLIEEDIGGYSELITKKFELESQIDELMIDTKYILLPDLTIWEKQRLDYFAIAPGLDHDENNSPSIAKILKEFVDKEAVDIYYKIGRTADDILHKEEMVSTEEEEACETIIHMQNFIKKFYKITDFEIEEV